MAIYDVHGNVISESDIVVDKTLTEDGQAADAAVVGQKFSELSEPIVNKEIWPSQKRIGPQRPYSFKYQIVVPSGN